ncbi:MAG: hypothetical protein LBQ33_05275 [Oscillospiraceae bacterium]|jgi:hypothetical protein|nr:hypothetical protein [Oscillospiraceae bacterium]
MEQCPLDFYIYLSAQRLGMLYSQLPQACIHARKHSESCNTHGLFDMQPPKQEDEACLRMTHIGQDRTSVQYKEILFEPTKLFQLRQVLVRLKHSGQLQPLRAQPAPGGLYHFCAAFAREADACRAKGSVALYARAQGCQPALRLLCSLEDFIGSCGEYWHCEAPLPLCGAMLCLCSKEEAVCGLPLCISFSQKSL